MRAGTRFSVWRFHSGNRVFCHISKIILLIYHKKSSGENCFVVKCKCIMEKELLQVWNPANVFFFTKTLHISNNCLVTCKGLWYYV